MNNTDLQFTGLPEQNLLFLIAKQAADDINDFSKIISAKKVPNSQKELETYYSLEFAKSSMASFIKLDLVSIFNEKLETAIKGCDNFSEILDEIINRNIKNLKNYYIKAQCEKIRRVYIPEFEKRIHAIDGALKDLKKNNSLSEEKIEELTVQAQEKQKQFKEAVLLLNKKINESQAKVKKPINKDSNPKNPKKPEKQKKQKLSTTDILNNLEYYNNGFEKIYSPYMSPAQKLKWQKSKIKVKEKVEEEYANLYEMAD